VRGESVRRCRIRSGVATACAVAVAEGFRVAASLIAGIDAESVMVDGPGMR